MTHDAVVVGAGLAGLAAAFHLHRRGLDVAVLEAGDAVGGRVRTDHVDGYTLDRGFQVLNTAYPELARVVDVDALDLQAFDPAVTVLVDGKRVTLGNPLHQPSTIPSALGLPVGGLGGKAAFGLYAGLCLSMPAESLKKRPDISARAAWRDAKIPDDLVDGLLGPFFAGVLLEQDLSTSRRFTDLMMRMFVRGRSTVPAGGMQRLPEQLAANLPPGIVRLSTPVAEVAADHVVTTGGEAVPARHVVVATDGWAAAGLLRDSLRPPPVRGVTTVYHAVDAWPGQTATLLLDGSRSPIANSIVISAAAPGYAPAGRALVSTSFVHGSQPEHLDGVDVRAALARLHDTSTARWELLATYDLPHALPGMPAPHPLTSPVRVRSGGETVYVAGDHRDTSSIQGALVSGRRAAAAVVEDEAHR